MEKGHKPPTLKTISEMTGLSLSTVSLSLRDGSRLKRETREKVAEAAAKIGYVPNRAGVRLRTGQTNVLALVLAPEQNTIDYTRRLIQGIGDHIQGTKYHLNVIPEFSTGNPVAAVEYILNNRTADGVILTHTSQRDPRAAMMLDADFPFVTHGRTEFRRPHAYLDFDATRYLQMGVQRLASLGRRNVALAVLDNQTTNFKQIEQSFERARTGCGLSGGVIKSPKLLGSPEAARDLGQQLARDGCPYDGLMCNNELTALAILGGLTAEGLTMGKEFDMVCKQTTEILPALQPQMDTIAEDLFASGTELASLLIRRINGDPTPDLQILNEPLPRWRTAS